MPELALHVRGRLPGLEQERGVRVPQAVGREVAGEGGVLSTRLNALSTFAWSKGVPALVQKTHSGSLPARGSFSALRHTLNRWSAVTSWRERSTVRP